MCFFTVERESYRLVYFLFPSIDAFVPVMEWGGPSFFSFPHDRSVDGCPMRVYCLKRVFFFTRFVDAKPVSSMTPVLIDARKIIIELSFVTSRAYWCR